MVAATNSSGQPGQTSENVRAGRPVSGRTRGLVDQDPVLCVGIHGAELFLHVARVVDAAVEPVALVELVVDADDERALHFVTRLALEKKQGVAW